MKKLLQAQKAQNLTELATIMVVVGIIGFFAFKPIAIKLNSMFLSNKIAKNNATTTTSHFNFTNGTKSSGKTSYVEVSGSNALIMALADNTKTTHSGQNSTGAQVDADEASSSYGQNAKIQIHSLLNNTKKVEDISKGKSNDLMAYVSNLLTTMGSSVDSLVNKIVEAVLTGTNDLVVKLNDIFNPTGNTQNLPYNAIVETDNVYASTNTRSITGADGNLLLLVNGNTRYDLTYATDENGKQTEYSKNPNVIVSRVTDLYSDEGVKIDSQRTDIQIIHSDIPGFDRVTISSPAGTSGYICNLNNDICINSMDGGTIYYSSLGLNNYSLTGLGKSTKIAESESIYKQATDLNVSNSSNILTDLNNLSE